MSRINYLLDKYAAGTCSRGEFEELMLLLQADENEEAVRSYMQKLYKSLDSEVISDLHIDEQGGMFQSEAPEAGGGRRIFWRKALAAAAVVSVVFTGLYYFTRPGGAPNKAENAKTISQIHTPAGSKTSVVLPDGTEVWLNSLSTLTYTTAEFNSGRREVSLTGEAMFRVKHDSLHPFVVHTRNFDVRDLGTV
ncbi:MAG TPA: FecR family protein, partial [Puia sp.]